MDYLQYGLTL